MRRSHGGWHALRYSEGRVKVTTPSACCRCVTVPHPSPAPRAASTSSTPFGVPQGVPHPALLGEGMRCWLGGWHALRYSEGRVKVTPPQPVAVV